MIYIIADDLTGATDAGVQFAKLGYSTHLHLLSLTDQTTDMPFVHHQHVQVIDTETRDANAITARDRLHAMLSSIHLTGDDVVYKKIDSTMRGHPGLEIEECLTAFKKSLCLLTPGFPAQRRITVGGYLLVDDQPLGSSDYYTGDLPAEEASYLPALLQSQTLLPIARLDLRDVMQGPVIVSAHIQEALHNGRRLLIADAVTPQHIETLIIGSLAHKQQMMYAGSAGLAHALAETLKDSLLPGDRKESAHIREDSSAFPLLIVNGSRRTISAQQIDDMRDRVPLVEVQVDPEQIILHREAHFQQCLCTLLQAIHEHHILVLRPSSEYQTEQRLTILRNKHGVDMDDIADLIGQYLGELSAQVVHDGGIKTLVLTGGATAIEVCSALHLDTLTIQEELFPGVALSQSITPDHKILNIITKAGGFGDSKTLYAIYQKLEHERKSIL